MNSEQQRLDEARNANTSWKKWGPYLSERQWDTARAMHLFATTTAEQGIEVGKNAAVIETGKNVESNQPTSATRSRKR